MSNRSLGEWGIQHDSAAGRAQFGADLEARRRAERGEPADVTRGRWYLGSKQFKQELLEQWSIWPHPIIAGLK